MLDDSEWRGDRGGHFTSESSLDVDKEADLDGIVLYCFPIETNQRANGKIGNSAEVYCLLLHQIELEDAFSSVGRLQILWTGQRKLMTS